MGRFIGEYRLPRIINKRGLFTYYPEAGNPLTYFADDGRVYRLQKSFETDLATVPRLLWIVPGWCKYDWPEAALLHDWLWEQRYTGTLEVSFRRSNRLLREAIRALGWGKTTSWAAWLWVTLLGWPWWIWSERGTNE